MSKSSKSFDMELFFHALGDRTRLRLLNLMGNDEICVCFFVETLKISQPKISRHLAYLRRVGIVAARRDGKWMHYRIVAPPDPHAAAVFTEVRDWLSNDIEMQNDRRRLVSVCCTPHPPVQLIGAPLPTSLATTGA